MKILYCNWVPTRALLLDGGGVSIYQNNLLHIFSDKENADVYYLTSSYAYDLIKTKPYIRKVVNCSIKGIKEYELVNSPILAPSYFSFNYIKPYFEKNNILNLICKFIRSVGGFDVIHFNNLEGFNANVLELKQIFPKTKFFYSLHNYFPFCAQVNFWYRDSQNCIDFQKGKKCLNCNLFPIDYQKKMFERSKYNNLRSKILKKIAYKIFLFCHKKIKNENNPNHLYRREEYVKLINKNIDIVLCVSKRVKGIALSMGLNPSKCLVQYIGTKYGNVSKYPNITSHNGDITMAYLGFMRRDKGFYFLLDSLERMPRQIAEHISLVIAARFTDTEAINRLNKIKDKFKGLNLINGYNYDNLKDVLSGVNLGIVPVLWEDNLPQVALEFTAFGIPVFTSDLGGAQEITMSSNFIFEAGNYENFISKLSYIISNKNSLSEFWPDSFSKRILVPLEEHCKQLYNLYSSDLQN